MNEPRQTLIAQRLANRFGGPLPANAPVRFEDSPVTEGLLDHLREHLTAGETHYTARPGVPELRSAIGREIGEVGGVKRDADGVIVTHGEGEALYVTLLGLGLGTGSSIAISGGCRHTALLNLLDIRMVGQGDPEATEAQAIYSELGPDPTKLARSETEGRIEIIALGGWLFSAAARSSETVLPPDGEILIGHLDSIPGLDHFRIGFVAGPPETVKRIQTWKQALSICTAGPSQRAALFAIGEENQS